MFRAKFAYEIIIHANRFSMPIDFPLSCVDPWATTPALAMLQLARFQEFKVPSTFSQVLFETVDKVIPDRHAEMPFVGVNYCSHPRSAAMNRTALHNLQGILDDFWQQPICLEGKIDGRCNRR
jgi:hypothetical protein